MVNTKQHSPLDYAVYVIIMVLYLLFYFYIELLNKYTKDKFPSLFAGE